MLSDPFAAAAAASSSLPITTIEEGGNPSRTRTPRRRRIVGMSNKQQQQQYSQYYNHPHPHPPLDPTERCSPALERSSDMMDVSSKRRGECRLQPRRPPRHHHHHHHRTNARTVPKAATTAAAAKPHPWRAAVLLALVCLLCSGGGSDLCHYCCHSLLLPSTVNSVRSYNNNYYPRSSSLSSTLGFRLASSNLFAKPKASPKDDDDDDMYSSSDGTIYNDKSNSNIPRDSTTGRHRRLSSKNISLDATTTTRPFNTVPRNTATAKAPATKPSGTAPRKKRRNNRNTLTLTNNYVLGGHELLSKEEEQRLGMQLRTAIQLRKKAQQLQEMKELQRIERVQAESLDNDDDDDHDLDDFNYNFRVNDFDENSLTMEEKLEEFLMKNRKSSSTFTRRSGHFVAGYGYDDFNELEDEESLGLLLHGIDHVDRLERFDSRSVTSNIRGTKNSLDILEIFLSNEVIVEELGIKGGRDELARIFVQGADAKNRLIECNIRLVTSISKKWLIGGSSSAAMESATKTDLQGSSRRPSLDEVVQQGIIGLAMAVERFEPERGLKLSTYATYYITNEVRKCVQSATTGCLRVPTNFYSIRSAYQKLVKNHYYQSGRSLDVQVAADSLGITKKRLEFVLRSTDPLVELDGAGLTGGGFANGSGKAGSFVQNSADLPTFAETLYCMEPSPEEVVERSLLRQCLENALAFELSPHERDVIRLRHGLDDGVSRTVREVAESCGGILSMDDIRRAESRAYSKLREPGPIHNRRLMGFASEFVSGDLSTAFSAKE